MTTPSSSGRHQRLAELTTVVSAPGIVLSQPSGDIGVTGIEGFFLDDRRILSQARVVVNGLQIDNLVVAHSDPASAEFTGLAAVMTSDADFGLDGDAQIVLVRRREIRRDGLLEQLEIRSNAPETVELTIEFALATDGTDVSVARTGASAGLLPPRVAGSDLAEWSLVDTKVEASFTPTPGTLIVADVHARATWKVLVASQTTEAVSVLVAASGALDRPPVRRPLSASIEGQASLVRLFDRSLADAHALIRTDGPDSADRYMSAGAPWYLTLFGRDSLWAARMLLPFDPGLAMGTLRALARRQGTRHDAVTAEQPGKILHEVRRASVAKLLPATYFGTADATALWVILLVESWRWGMSRHDTASLLPTLRAALGWLEKQVDAGGGFIEYQPDSAGLTNQGWKDSRDAIHDYAGRNYEGAVALAEVQGYAHLAAMGAAELLGAFGDPEAERWQDWAEALRGRFSRRFWTEHDDAHFPAIAVVDRTHLADSATSNMAHLLGTGIVSDREAARIAERLSSDDLASPFGLRTLSTGSPRYNPFSYHNGSIWPHDTAIAIRGLAQTGHTKLAARLAEGLLSAAERFDYRLPELWSGEVTAGGTQGSTRQPIPYPTACTPQAWSSASIAAIVTSALGLSVDVPGGRIQLRPPRPLILGDFTVRGIRIGTGTLDVRVDEGGEAHVLKAPPGVIIE